MKRIALAGVVALALLGLSRQHAAASGCGGFGCTPGYISLSGSIGISWSGFRCGCGPECGPCGGPNYNLSWCGSGCCGGPCYGPNAYGPPAMFNGWGGGYGDFGGSPVGGVLNGYGDGHGGHPVPMYGY
jgi:hypothetical protein